MGQGRIAAADAQHGAAVRDAVDAGDGGRRRGGMARHRVGDAGAETEPGRRRGGERQRDIRIARQVLRIDDQHAVPTGSLDLLRRARRTACRRHRRHPQLHVLSSVRSILVGGVPITSRYSGRSAGTIELRPSMLYIQAMSAPDLTLIREFKRRAEKALPGRIVRVVLYGSRARGDARPDSDWDVAIF